MKTFYKCPYYDCGWCYAPPWSNSNDKNGQCNNMEDCPCATQMEVDRTHRWEEDES